MATPIRTILNGAVTCDLIPLAVLKLLEQLDKEAEA